MCVRLAVVVIDVISLQVQKDKCAVYRKQSVPLTVQVTSYKGSSGTYRKEKNDVNR